MAVPRVDAKRRSALSGPPIELVLLASRMNCFCDEPETILSGSSFGTTSFES
jgi:hypothetical protein